MSWRTAREDEDEAIASLSMALYADDPAPTPMSRGMALSSMARLRDEPLRGRVVVYDVGEGLVAYAILCAFWSNELGGEVCIIDELYVKPEARGRGVSTGLVRSLAAGTMPWFRDAVAVELEVTPSNRRARELYQRLGFAPYKNTQMRLRRDPPADG
jgi:GNAT superfamily N-acetyltransferase